MKYQYKSVTDLSENRLVEKLNALGEQGWELISVCYCQQGSCFCCVFKVAGYTDNSVKLSCTSKSKG